MNDAPSVYFLNIAEGKSYNVKQTRRNYPAFGLMLLSAILSEAGFRVAIRDVLRFEQDMPRVLRQIKREQPVFVGLSVMTPQIPEALRVSRAVKKAEASIPIVWGGAHATLFPESTLRNSPVDITVINEATRHIVDLARQLQNRGSLENVPGIAFKKNGHISCSGQSLPDNIQQCPHLNFTALEDVDSYCVDNSFATRMVENTKRARTFPVVSGLGCCYRCSFCINVALKRRYRFRDAQNLIDEIKRLQRDHDADTFVFQDEDFFVSKKRLFEFLDLVEKEKLNFRWRTWGRANYFSEDYLSRSTVQRLDQCGLREIAIGAESGSQKILDDISKGITVEQIIKSAEYMYGTNIVPRYSFMYGFPNETREDLIMTFDLAIRLIMINPKSNIGGPYFLRLYPGSPLFEKVTKKYNIQIPNNLDEWSIAFSNQGYLHPSKYPWLSRRHYAFSQLLIFYLSFFMFPGRAGTKREVLSKCMKRLATWRFKKMQFDFPVEYYFYNLKQRIF